MDGDNKGTGKDRLSHGSCITYEGTQRQATRIKPHALPRELDDERTRQESP
jgi:hypothetical protein